MPSISGPEDLPTGWPPSLGKGNVVICAKVAARVDDVFNTLWVGSACGVSAGMTSG
jgi:hypothetical protein